MNLNKKGSNVTTDEDNTDEHVSDNSNTESDTLQPLERRRKTVVPSAAPEDDTQPRTTNASRMRTAGGNDGGVVRTPRPIDAVPSSQLAEREDILRAVFGSSPIHEAPQEPVGGDLPLSTETTSSHAPFEWANTEHGMIPGDEGFYFNQEGVRFRRISEEGNHTFVEASSIFDENTGLDRVPSEVVDAMVAEGAMDYADPLITWEMRPREGRGATPATG